MSVEVLIKFFVEGKDEIIMHAFPAHDVERELTISSAYSSVREMFQFVCVHSSWQFSIPGVLCCYFLTSVRPSTSQHVFLYTEFICSVKIESNKDRDKYDTAGKHTKL